MQGRTVYVMWYSHSMSALLLTKAKEIRLAHIVRKLSMCINKKGLYSENIYFGPITNLMSK